MRNLTFEQRKYAIGKMYEARKKSKGNNAERGENGKYLIDQNDPTGDKPKSTAEAINIQKWLKIKMIYSQSRSVFKRSK